MEIFQISKNSIKIKGKNSSFAVDPNDLIKAKTQADAVIVLLGESLNLDKIEEQRVIIQGPGEYEVSGTKVTGFLLEGKNAYSLQLDGIDVLLASLETLKKLKEPTRDYKILVLNANAIIDGSEITALAPSVVLLFGEKAEDVAKTLSGNTSRLPKFVLKKEQLPEEMQVVVLQ